VPAQRPSAPPPAETQPISPAQPTGQIGGRAMLAPGESLTDHLAKLQQSNTPGNQPGRQPGNQPGNQTGNQTRGRRRAPEMGDTMAGGPPTGMMPATRARPAGPSPADPTDVLPPREAWDGARAAREPLAGTVHASPGVKRKAQIDNVVGAVKGTTGRALTTVKGWPRKKQLIAAGSAAGLVLVLILAISLSGGGSAKQPVTQSGAGGPANASFETQDYQGNAAVSVKVPKGWTRSAAGSYVDYVDPQDKERKVRVVVEKGSITPKHFVTSTAPGTLKKSKNCPSPFAELATSDVKVDGHDGAQFEYTCGSGGSMRHGIWRETTVDGKMYSFYLTTSESDFGASKKYFDAMAESFKLSV
jgi:hypothetical protein